MKHLYTAPVARRWQRRATLTLSVAVGVPVLALAGCIIMCTQVHTGNARQLLLSAIALSTLAGWMAILLVWFAYLPARAQAQHMAGMLAETPATLEGVLTLSRETFAIPGSIIARRATLRTDDGETTLHINAALARQLPTGGQTLRLLTVRRFITGFEVIA